MPLDRLIRTVGMRTFVRYYDSFRNNSVQEIIHEMKLRENFTLNSQKTKASTGKKYSGNTWKNRHWRLYRRQNWLTNKQGKRL
ncbi:MAG: hypothetical protein Pg6C_20790 [Treponemataceae bacterium]|nr:MAG: hypothetical protein Pg6C_20790 [Treponemataceae bacterium]